MSRRPSSLLARLALAAVVPTALVPTALAPTAAVAATAQDGLWYVDALALDEAQQTATGAGITVAVIDGAIDPTVPELADADLTVHEPAFCDCDEDGTPDPATSQDRNASHGTSMTTLVAGSGRGGDGVPGVRGVAPGAQVRHYTIGTQGAGLLPSSATGSHQAALRQAVADGADIVSMSFGGSTPGEEEPWREAVAEALRAGVVLVASAGNLEEFVEFPGNGNGVVTATHFGPDGEMVDGDNVPGPHVDVAAPGRDVLSYQTGPEGGYWLTSGSSSSTAIVAGLLALAWSAHPEATGNQMIQALLRTTESSDGELSRYDDWWGYGKVSPARLLASDPTSYPDVNPLLVEGPDQVPTLEEVLGSADAAAAPGAPAEGTGTAPDPAQEPATDAAPGDAGTTAGSATTPVLLGVAGAVAVVVLVALATARARRRQQAQQHITTGTPVEEGISRA